MSVQLHVRTPSGEVFAGAVVAIQAEDASGWFGIRQGREDVVAVLPPGLLAFRDEQGDGFIALSGGLLSLERSVCRVTTRDAVFSRTLDDVAQRLEKLHAERATRTERRRDVLDQLAREALRRMVQERRL